MGSSQIVTRERHGDHFRLVCFAVGGAHSWDSEWESYSPNSVRVLMEYYRQVSNIHKTLLRFLLRDGEVLEAGSGLGYWVAILDEAGYQVRGMDYSEEALARAKQTFPKLRFDRGDVRELPYPEGSMSGYVSFGVAEHFREGPETVLREAARVLCPGGILIFSVPWISPLRRLQPCSEERPQSANFYQYFFEREEIESLVVACGFRLIGRSHYGTLKTIRDVYRGLRSRWSPREIFPRGLANASRVDKQRLSPTSGARPLPAWRRLSWFFQNLALENVLSRRLASHMLLLAAERVAETDVSVIRNESSDPAEMRSPCANRI